MKVHVIEDEPDLQKAAGFYLKNDDFEVTKSTDGDKAVEEAAATKPDVILLDLVLPGKSGINVLKDLRAAGILVPVIVMTNLPTENIDRATLTELGVHTILTKVHTSFSELSDIVFAAYREQVERDDNHSEPSA